MGDFSADRFRWNERYRSGAGQARVIDSFLSWAYEAFVAKEFPRGGTALDLATGLGRHAFWLADRNWDVTAVDFSDVALEKARKSAGAQSSKVTFCSESIDYFLEHSPQFDLVLGFLYLNRREFDAIERAVRPGGFLIYKTYTTAQKHLGKGPSDPEHLLEPGELAAAFPGLRTLHYAEIEEQSATAELVAQSPA